MDINRLQQLAGVPLTEAQSGDQQELSNMIDSAVQDLLDNNQEVTEENVIQWIKSKTTLSMEDINKIRRQLADEVDTSPAAEQQEQAVSEQQLWNRVMKMVSQADEAGIVEDVGQKRYGGVKYHEFMIDGHVFQIMLDEGER